MSASGQKSASLRYDPLGRLYEVGGAGGLTRFLYDGDELVAEYNGSGALLRRYAHGAGADDPVLWYEGAGTASPRWLHADRQGSIVAASDASGTALAINAYDEWGIPQASNSGRFQYTGQAWLPELGMYHYKARIYSPTLGRFLQTDPVGYDDQINLYAYVGNDPVNHTEPTGLAGCGPNTKYDSATCTTTQVGEANPRRAQGNSQGQQDSAAGRTGKSTPQDENSRRNQNGQKVVNGTSMATGALFSVAKEMTSSKLAKFILSVDGKILIPLGVTLKYQQLRGMHFSDRAAAVGAFSGLATQVHVGGVGSAIGALAGTFVEPGGGTAGGALIGGLLGEGADWAFGWSDKAALNSAREIDGR